MKKGVLLIEFIVGIVIFLILISGIFFAIRNVIDKAKVMSAKTQISQLALLLEQVKTDTGLYPGFLSDLLSNSPPKTQEKGWNGPYTNKIPLDPWGNPYFYKVPPTTVFESPKLPRVHGKPDPYTATFNAIEGKGRLRIINYGVTSCSIYLNGIKIVDENEFKNKPIPQIIEKEITLNAGNNIFTLARSTPGDFLYFSIIVDNMPTGEYFEIGSYGKDGKEGGYGYKKDIIWRSDKYPNFIQ
ncbi:MAG: type II secretion system protein GspG [Candidatus Omnitrophica bacterium]|nr:type II secretion system protein GspG [Candidatus Omnitrophota bacterium]